MVCKKEHCTDLADSKRACLVADVIAAAVAERYLLCEGDWICTGQDGVLVAGGAACT